MIDEWNGFEIERRRAEQLDSTPLSHVQSRKYLLSVYKHVTTTNSPTSIHGSAWIYSRHGVWWLAGKRWAHQKPGLCEWRPHSWGSSLWKPPNATVSSDPGPLKLHLDGLFFWHSRRKLYPGGAWNSPGRRLPDDKQLPSFPKCNKLSRPGKELEQP